MCGNSTYESLSPLLRDEIERQGRFVRLEPHGEGCVWRDSAVSFRLSSAVLESGDGDDHDHLVGCVKWFDSTGAVQNIPKFVTKGL